MDSCERTEGCSTPDPDTVASCRADIIGRPTMTPTSERADLEGSPSASMDSIYECLHVLKLHTEVDRLIRALSDLTGCFRDPQKINEELLSNLEEQRVQEDILICMHNFHSNETVQKLGCELLSVLIQLSTEITNDMVNKDIHQRIFRVFLSHPSDVEVLVASLTTLYLLAELPTVRRKMLCGEGDVVGQLIRVIHVFPDHPHLLCKVFIALRVIIQDDANVQSDLVKNGDYKYVLTSLRKHGNHRALVRDACRLLHLLASEATIFLGTLDGIVQILISDDIHEMMVNVIYHFSEDEEILEPALGILNVLSVEENVLQGIASTDLVSASLRISMKFAAASSIQIHIFNIIEDIFSFEDELSYVRPSEQSLDWLRQVYLVMGNHREDPQVQDASCILLVRLLELYPELKQNIGENPELEQYPLQNLLFGALLMHDSEAHVVIACCDAIYWIAADNECIQNQLVQKNVFVAVCHAMKTHKSDNFVQEAGCRALRGLCIFSQDNKEMIGWNIDLSDVFRPLACFPENPLVQMEAIGIIATLADTELVRSKCIIEDIHQKILVAIETHETIHHIQEVSFEALAILCATDGGVSVLNECQAIEKVLMSMRAHPHSQAIQRKGLVLLQLLVDDYDFADDVDLSSDVIKVIVSAMSNHEEECGVMTEGCVAMLIMMERPFTAAQLVQNQAHGRLFHILENLKEYQSLTDLADECLYLLYSCDTKLRSQMLRYACAQGITRGVECLIQLGAEVNVGSGTDTPLCHACRQGDEHMVGILLQQGVTDLQTPLQLALQAGKHNITGMILAAHMGYDQQAGVVSWSGLELDDVIPEWLEPTFLESSAIGREISDSGKAMAKRVRRSEERRNKRLKQHHAEPAESRATRRLSLRYSFYSNRTFENLEEYVQKLEENRPEDTRLQKPKDGSSQDSTKKKGPLAFIKRTFQTFKNRRKNNASIATSIKKAARKKSDLIKSISTTKLALLDKEGYQAGSQHVEVAEFAQCPEELREWKEYTLTGSNVPFSPLDPRRSREKVIYKQPRAVPGEWQRKSPFRVSRRRSDSMLMLYKTSGSSRSLKLPSQSSQQELGVDPLLCMSIPTNV